LEYLFSIAVTAAKNSKIPIALHLDHGKDLNIIKRCIQIGYSSVMFDGSHLSLDENIKRTRQVVKLAHKKNISVEAELGTIGGKEDQVVGRQILYTDPQQARSFVSQTHCDFLAVAIGTSHGAYKFAGPAKLNISLLQEIARKVSLPLVLHGASGVPKSLVNEAGNYGADWSHVQGVPDQEIRKTLRYGISKINTDTDLRMAFTAAVRRSLHDSPKEIDPRSFLARSKEKMQKVAEQRIRLFGSTNHA
jgi:fructose-bisphosphate aldolase class II